MITLKWHVEATGQELTRKAVPSFLNTSMRKEWTAANVIGLGVFPIIETPQPEHTEYQRAEPGERIKIGDEYHRVWDVVDKFSTQAEIDAYLAQELATVKVNKKSQVDQLLATKIYTDIEVTFPSGPAVIQFRNETDRTNLSNVVQSAQILVAAGVPETQVVYRTQDNVIQVLTAAQIIPIGMYVMGAKQAIQTVAWGHKDAIEILKTIAEINAYDITIGW